MVDHKQRVDLVQYFVIHRDAVKILLKQCTQLLVFAHQCVLFFVHGYFVEEHLVVAFPEVLKGTVLVHYLRKMTNVIDI